MNEDNFIELKHIEGVYWDALNPLKPVEGESTAASRALTDYATMGFRRSLERLFNKYEDMEDPPITNKSTLSGYCMKYDWVDRAKRFDELQRERDESTWRERRDQIREKEWDNFYRLQEIVSDILDDMPKFVHRQEKVVDKGSATVVDAQGRMIHEGRPKERVIVLSMDVNAAIKFIRTASDIGRRAAEMDKTMPNLLKEIDFAKLSPEQIERVAEGEHLLDVLGIRK